jgi:DNA polymerase V
MESTEVGDVWGVGRKIGAQLNETGIKSVLGLKSLDPAMVKHRWSVVLERTVRELQGRACIDFDDQPAAKKEIACTRSFGHSVLELRDLLGAVTEFASRAAEKLRKLDGHTAQFPLFIRSSPFRAQEAQYSRSVVVPLRRPTDDSAAISQAALAGLHAIYQRGSGMPKRE